MYIFSTETIFVLFSFSFCILYHSTKCVYILEKLFTFIVLFNPRIQNACHWQPFYILRHDKRPSDPCFQTNHLATFSLKLKPLIFSVLSLMFIPKPFWHLWKIQSNSLILISKRTYFLRKNDILSLIQDIIPMFH